MARQFGNYSPAVPLGVTWEESLQILDDANLPVDLTGYAVRAQLRESAPLVDAVSGTPISDPIFEITSTGFYAVSPVWPVVEGFSVPVPSNGTILLSVAGADTWKGSPTNIKTKLRWSLVLVNPVTKYAIPVVSGKVAFLPADTV